MESSDIKVKRTAYLIEELLEEFEQGLIRRHQNQKVTIETEDTMAFVHIDSKLILQVLFNLVDNALKHSGTTSEIKLCIHLQPSRVRFEMIDFGKGIPEEERHLIYKPYYSGDYFKDNKKTA